MFGRGPQGGGGGKVCNFYQQGRCKFGDSCKFEHPGANRPQDSGNRFQALGNQANSYGQANRNNQRPPAPGRGQHYTGQNSYAVTRDGIEADLRNEKPQWPFSAYGPGKDAPIQLFGGYPLEQSPEEMRLLYYQAVSNGNPQQAAQSEQQLLTETDQQIQRALSDLDGAVKYVLDGEAQHPNRIDMCQPAVGNVFHRGRKLNSKFSGPQAATPPAQSGAFGQPSAIASGNAFGQPSNLGGGGGFGQASNLGQNPSPFGQPANGGFGSASVLGQKPSPFGQPAAGGFGQASALGAKPSAFGQPAAQAGGFGQPSALGKSSPFGQPSVGAQSSPFGQPSGGPQSSPFAQTGQPAQAQQGAGFGQASAFGQPSALGNNQQAGAFGQPSALGQQQRSAFGQPSGLGQQPQSAFGQPSALASQGTAFGLPSVPGQGSAFGQPSAPGQSSAFGQPSTVANQQTSAFGQPSAPTQQNNVFGNTSTPAQQTGTFGQPAAPAQQTNAFGQPSAPAQQQSAFGKPSPFGQAQSNQQQSPFAQAAAAAKPNPFGLPSQTTNNNQTNGTFGQAVVSQQQQQPQSYAESLPQGEWITRNPDGTLQRFKGMPVQYVGASNTEDAPIEPHYRRANGNMERIWHPEGKPARRPEMEAAAEAYTAEHEAAYRYMAEQGVFKDGIMPEMPPMCDWIRWDL